VNAISPGATDTPLNQVAYTADVRKTYNECIPLGHIATPSEIGDIFVFLASDASRYITGVELLVDGGMVLNGNVGHARTHKGPHTAAPLRHPPLRCGQCRDGDRLMRLCSRPRQRGTGDRRNRTLPRTGRSRRQRQPSDRRRGSVYFVLPHVVPPPVTLRRADVVSLLKAVRTLWRSADVLAYGGAPKTA
jgi:hypothetical protein